MRRVLLLLIFGFIFSKNSFSQKGMTVVGLQFKPIYPASFLGTGKLTNDSLGVRFETELTSGFSAGIIVRHNFTKLIAFETGINYVKRKYTITITDSDFVDKSIFRSIGYEIPALAMIYSQLGEKIYINGSMGPIMDMFPSSIETKGEFYHHVSYRNHIFQPALTANVGIEYRTNTNGIIYLGASYQRPFTFIYFQQVRYTRNGKDVTIQNELLGSYLTIDLRYFFPHTTPKNVTE